MNTISKHLQEKYGEEIYYSLVDGTKKLKLKKGANYELYKDNLEKQIIERFIVPITRTKEDKKEWAFDFPGWIGALENKGKDNNKEIFVIGLEPHISESSFQVTYGLRETKENEFDEICFGNNKKLWKNLFDLFNSESTTIDKFFLNRFYITDLCHFAPRGNANLIREIPNWEKIREEIALKYIPNEIDLLSPKFIVSQGLAVCDIIDNKILKKIGKVLDWISPEELNRNFETRYKNLPFLSKYEFKGKILYHIGLPHLASGNTNDFWKNKEHIKFIKDQINKIEK